MVVQELLTIGIVTVLVGILQYLNKTILREALTEVASFYSNKDREEKSIVYSIISLMQKPLGVEKTEAVPKPEIQSELMKRIVTLELELDELKQKVEKLENEKQEKPEN